MNWLKLKLEDNNKLGPKNACIKRLNWFAYWECYFKLVTQYTCVNVASWFEMSARFTWDEDWMPRIETET